jgi:hypothetical protein
MKTLVTCAAYFALWAGCCGYLSWVLIFQVDPRKVHATVANFHGRPSGRLFGEFIDITGPNLAGVLLILIGAFMSYRWIKQEIRGSSLFSVGWVGESGRLEG